MRYRRIGLSQLEVSEVGFGTWTLASDWWGEVPDKAGMLHAALDAGINFIDTAPVYGEDGVGETLARRRPRGEPRRHRAHHEVRLRHRRRARNGTQRERPHDWRPESIRTQLEDSLRRLGTDYIDLYQLHNCRLEPVLDDALWETLDDLVAAGQGPRARRRARTGDRLGRGGDRVGPATRHLLAADRVQHARAGARPHVRGRAARSRTAR